MSQIGELLTAFRELKVIDCGMWHEQVEREPEGKVPKPATLPGDVRYKRVKFCDRSTRDHLGCAHTSCRRDAVLLVDEIGHLLVDGAQGNEELLGDIAALADKYKNAINQLELGVIQCDNKKGQLELDHAAVCERITNQGELAVDEEFLRIEREIDDVIAQHNALNGEIRTLQQATIRDIMDLEAKLH